jgi:hypothetical protein
MTPFPFNFPSLCSLSFYILLLLITEYYYHMLVFTKYHWNISFQKEFPVKYVVKNARSVTHFVWQTFLPFNSQKKFNCEGKLLHTHPLLYLYLWDKKKLVTNNKKLLNSYIWHRGCPNWGWLYLIDSLQIKQLYNSFIICKILVYIFNIFYLTNTWN